MVMEPAGQTKWELRDQSHPFLATLTSGGVLVFVSGPDFSRAVKACKRIGLQPLALFPARNSTRTIIPGRTRFRLPG
jgi:hypothetical protein